MSRTALGTIHIMVGLLVLSAGSTGCSALRIHTYQGVNLPEGYGATLFARSRWYGGERTTVHSVDGRRIPLYGLQEIHILPGLRRIEVSYSNSQMYSTENAHVTFFAEPGSSYEVRAAKIRRGFWSELVLAASIAGSTTWTTWVVELPSERTVAGRKPIHSPWTTTFEDAEDFVVGPAQDGNPQDAQ